MPAKKLRGVLAEDAAPGRGKADTKSQLEPVFSELAASTRQYLGASGIDVDFARSSTPRAPVNLACDPCECPQEVVFDGHFSRRQTPEIDWDVVGLPRNLNTHAARCGKRICLHVIDNQRESRACPRPIDPLVSPIPLAIDAA